eukprot:27838-Eustigmatos_ZCMA.PRE.1
MLVCVHLRYAAFHTPVFLLRCVRYFNPGAARHTAGQHAADAWARRARGPGHRQREPVRALQAGDTQVGGRCVWAWWGSRVCWIE